MSIIFRDYLLIVSNLLKRWLKKIKYLNKNIIIFYLFD